MNLPARLRVSTSLRSLRRAALGLLLGTSLPLTALHALSTVPVKFDLLTWEPSAVGAPIARTVAPGGRVQLAFPIVHIAPVNYAYEWYHNGIAMAGRNQSVLELENVQPVDTGTYTVVGLDPSGPRFHYTYIVGLATEQKIVGDAAEVLSNARHRNGNVFDQMIMTGTHATVRADPGQITRVSFLDLSDDIVQVEFAGAGTLSISLSAANGPVQPAHYNQAVGYMKGHASITVVGADASTQLSIFSVGRMNAFDPTGAFDFTQPPSAINDPARNGNPIFVPGFEYDGIADVAFVAIGSAQGKFGSLRCGNAGFFASAGLVGVYAPLVQFEGAFNLHDVTATHDAIPALLTGPIGADIGTAEISRTSINVCGGSLAQSNARAVQVGDARWVRFTAGITSHGHFLPALANQAAYTRYGVDVTSQIVLDPTP